MKLDYSAIRFLDEVPKVFTDDAEQPPIPEWQRIITAGRIAKKAAEKREREILVR